MTRIDLTYFGMAGSGPTVKAAKEDAGRRIEAALSGDYAPVLVRWRKTVGVMSRDTEVWGYRLVHDDDQRPAIRLSHCSTDTRGRDECLYSMLVHIADIERLDADTEPPELFASLTPRAQQRAEAEWHGRSAWYAECAAAKAAGKVYIGGHWCEPEVQL